MAKETPKSQFVIVKDIRHLQGAEITRMFANIVNNVPSVLAESESSRVLVICGSGEDTRHMTNSFCSVLGHLKDVHAFSEINNSIKLVQDGTDHSMFIICDNRHPNVPVSKWHPTATRGIGILPDFYAGEPLAAADRLFQILSPTLDVAENHSKIVLAALPGEADAVFRLCKEMVVLHRHEMSDLVMDAAGFCLVIRYSGKTIILSTEDTIGCSISKVLDADTGSTSASASTRERAPEPSSSPEPSPDVQYKWPLRCCTFVVPPVYHINDVYGGAKDLFDTLRPTLDGPHESYDIELLTLSSEVQWVAKICYFMGHYYLDDFSIVPMKQLKSTIGLVYHGKFVTITVKGKSIDELSVPECSAERLLKRDIIQVTATPEPALETKPELKPEFDWKGGARRQRLKRFYELHEVERGLNENARAPRVYDDISDLFVPNNPPPQWIVDTIRTIKQDPTPAVTPRRLHAVSNFKYESPNGSQLYLLYHSLVSTFHPDFDVELYLKTCTVELKKDEKTVYEITVSKRE